jgi:hypothetical protein
MFGRPEGTPSVDETRGVGTPGEQARDHPRVCVCVCVCVCVRERERERERESFVGTSITGGL